MGGACARCSEVKKAKSDAAPGKHPDIEESDAEEESSDDENRSEIAASSEDDENQEDYKQDVEDILTNTGKNLKRGKTMAMKEAIATAKKHGIESSKVLEAEKVLEAHKKQERREEIEKEVDAFFASSLAKDIKICEKLLRKATEADCTKEVINKLQTHFDELIITRPLEKEEVERGQDTLKQSCREFVLVATSSVGRPMQVWRGGKKVPSVLTIDSALQTMHLALQDVSSGSGRNLEAPVGVLQVYMPTLLMGKRSMPEPSKDGSGSGSSPRGSPKKELAIREKTFRDLEEEDLETAMAIRFEREGIPEEDRVWCFVEPTPVMRDRLFEALVVLTSACKV
mmetsp:Transcript_7988/g.20638  ORF Transcript_7988/g.20638 Transcript_7988/m.20638 type:complete len:341 (-) Transcript_7988:164-1186(-)